MDSVFNDIEFLMGNMKQETPNTNERTEPSSAAEGVPNNDTDQLAMSTYMTDFILDYINRSLKEEETQPENNESEGANEEESVEDLIERAENMIRENLRQNEQSSSMPETSAAVMNNEWMQQINYQLETREDNNPIEQITDPAPVSSNSGAMDQPSAVIEAPDVISVDTDSSDDEVIFVNSHKPATEIPVIDLSDHVDVAFPADNSLQPSSNRHESRKRTNRPEVYFNTAPTVQVPQEYRPQEKQFRHNCAICLDDVKAPHSTTCGHIYCGDCIKNALKIFKKCPSCNKKLKLSNVHPIYL